MLNRGLDEVNNMLTACDSAVNRGGDVIHLGVCGETTDVFTDCLCPGRHRGKGGDEKKKVCDTLCQSSLWHQVYVLTHCDRCAWSISQCQIVLAQAGWSSNAQPEIIQLSLQHKARWCLIISSGANSCRSSCFGSLIADSDYLGLLTS